jgi:hypothetical protein
MQENAEEVRCKKRAYAQQYARSNAVILKQKRLDESTRWIEFLRSAKKRNIPVQDVIQLQSLTTQQCHYCGYTPDVGRRNGLDRIDNDREYNIGTTVSCCGVCNRMKGGMSGAEFVYRCNVIKANIVCTEPWTQENIQHTYYDIATSSTGDAPKTMLLKGEEIKQLRYQPCTFCNRSPSFGVDRINSFGPYEKGNVQSCCTICNFMKNILTLSAFMSQVQYIVQNNAVTQDYDGTKCGFFVQFNINPVRCRCTLADSSIIFPSARIASRIIGCAKQKLYDALKNQVLFRGVTWELATHKEYNVEKFHSCVDLLNRITVTNTNL